VLDRRRLGRPDGLRRGLDGLIEYWRGKSGHGGAPLRAGTTARVLTALRPDFDAVPTLAQLATTTEAELARLTDNQYRALDAHARNQRIVFEGGAGTGKTMLAAEVCRRRAMQGGRVLFTCTSGVLAGFVKGQPGLADVDVLPFGRLAIEAAPPYDVIVVDEAQDLLNFNDLPILDRLLTGGLEDGSWYLLLDSNNQTGLVRAFERDAMDYVLSFRPAEIVLTDNCRNTRQIVAETRRLTGADVGVSSAGSGPDVRTVVADGRDEQALAAAAYLDELAGSGVRAADIVLLSPLPFQESMFAALPARWRQRIGTLDNHAMRRRPTSRLGFARIGNFKGLESPFILLGDLGPQDSASWRPNLYVGMTRARVGLWLAVGRPDRSGQGPGAEAH
jgi:hypothetical protein